MCSSDLESRRRRTVGPSSVHRSRGGLAAVAAHREPHDRNDDPGRRDRDGKCHDKVRGAGEAHGGGTGTRVAARVRTTDLVATKAIVAITVGAFIVIALRDGRFDGRGPTSADLALFGPLVHDGQWWRLVTCSLVHFGPMHLLDRKSTRLNSSH